VRLDQLANARGGFQAAHALGPDGTVDRLFLNMWVEVSGARGRIHPLEGPGEQVVAGRVFAEHTFTRLFAPPDQRKVTRLEAPGVAEIPPAVHAFQPPATAGELPPGAVPLDDAPVPDPAPLRFGLDHTDSNQHVNSLVYPWVFTEAALRRLDAHGIGGSLLVRFVEMSYRKPCFAGDRVVCVMRAFRLGERYGAAGWIVPVNQPDARPHCYGRLIFG
jgi:hypothetical protein